MADARFPLIGSLSTPMADNEVLPTMEMLGEEEILELDAELFPFGQQQQEPAEEQTSQGGSQPTTSQKKGAAADALELLPSQEPVAPPMIVGTPLVGTPRVVGTPSVRTPGGTATPVVAGGGGEDPRNVPYARRSKVLGAKYHSPIARPKTVPANSGFRFGFREFKTEQWRERGFGRWPPAAAVEMMRHPKQFQTAQDVVPLIRKTTNAQPNVNIELWTRSLRTKQLNLSKIGFQNPELAPSTVKQMFDSTGVGFSGATPRSAPYYAASTSNYSASTLSGGCRISLPPPMSDWVESPVATGRYALKHMDGCRYEFDQTPRSCVPERMIPPGVSQPAVSQQG